MSETPPRKEKSNDPPTVGDHFPNTRRLLESQSPVRPATPEPDDETFWVGGESDDETALLEDLPEKDRFLRRVCTVHRRHAASTAQHRIEQAAKRREKLREERMQHLKQVDARRKSKLQRTRALRHAALEAFLKDGLEPLERLRQAGLGVTEGLTPDIVEMILMNDPRSCTECECDGRAVNPTQSVCPLTHRPHRRSLVVAAEKFLRLVGDTRINLVPNAIGVTGSAAPVASQPKANRGIAVNPQMFVLATYNALLPLEEVDPLLTGAAESLLQATERLREALVSYHKDPTAVDPENYIKPLLVSFAQAWRQYAPLTVQSISAMSAEERESVQKELVRTTGDALASAYRQLARLTSIARGGSTTAAPEGLVQQTQLLATFITGMRSRLEQLGGSNALAEFDLRMLNEERANGAAGLQGSDRDGAADVLSSDYGVTPVMRPMPQSLDAMAPLQLSSPASVLLQPPRAALISNPGPVEYVGTSGSDTDVGGRFAARSQRLPEQRRASRWGESRPDDMPSNAAGAEPLMEPTSTRDELRRLEYRARCAYTAKMRRNALLMPEEASEKAAREAVTATMDDELWCLLADELNSTPPKIARIPLLLSGVADELLEALPRRLRNTIGQEIRDVLDWDQLRQQISVSSQGFRIGSITSLLTYVVHRIKQLSAPVREEQLERRAMELVQWADTVSSGQPAPDGAPSTVGQLVAEMFKFMFLSIRQLRREIAEYSLKLVSHELVEKAVEYEGVFVGTCLPDPSQWTSTKAFLQRFGEEAATGGVAVLMPSATADQPAQSVALLDALPASQAFASADHRRIIAALLAGIVDLLRSAGRVAETRWLDYPSEALYLARPLIFEAASNVQLCTVRLMISGAVAMILSVHRVRGPAQIRFIHEIDDHVVAWLDVGEAGKGAASGSKEVHTIDDLKLAVHDKLGDYLASEAGAAAPLGPSPQRREASQEPQDAAALTPDDISVLNGIMGKMVDSCSPQYTTFEKRVLSAVLLAALRDLEAWAAGRNVVGSRLCQAADAALKACGSLIPAAVNRIAALVTAVLVHNWEVYCVYYPAVLASPNTAEAL